MIEPMDQQLDERLSAIEKKLDENHAILIRMRRVQRNAGLFRIFYWLVIIGLTAGSFYFIQPYLQQITSVYSGFQDTQESIKNNIPDVGNLNKLLEQVKGL